MKRIDLRETMNEVNMSMITDEDNMFFYDIGNLHMCKDNQKIEETTLKFNLKASKEEKDAAVSDFVNLLTDLNGAFNRSVSAPESMKLFKILNISSRYSGNGTVTVKVDVATLSNGEENALGMLLKCNNMSANIWGTKAGLFKIMPPRESKETHGLGNALRSWKTVARKHAE